MTTLAPDELQRLIDNGLQKLRDNWRTPREERIIRDLAGKIGVQLWPSFIERAQDTRSEVYFNGGWRGTKTYSADFSFFLYVIQLLYFPGEHLAWIVGPDYEQTRPDFFNLQEWAIKMTGLIVQSTDRQDGSLSMHLSAARLPGKVEIVTKSGADPNKLGSVGPKVILAAEAGQMSQETANRIRGRSMTHNAPVFWSGTFENEDGKPQFTWFEKESAEYLERPTDRRKAYSLPSYENLALFGSCTEGFSSVNLDPTLKQFCPDDNHGPAHSGIDPNHPDKIIGTEGVPLHPILRERYEGCRQRPLYWRKFYEGKPTTITNPIYEWASASPEQFCKPAPDDLKFILSAGGMDFGLGGINHPSACTVVSLTDEGDVWVRFSAKDASGMTDWVWHMQEQLDNLYGFWLPAQNRKGMGWAHDNSLRYPPSFTNTRVVSVAARFARVGIVNSYALSGHLYFDSGNPGCVALFEELQRVHFEESRSGKVDYARENDDMTASLECAMVEIHQPHIIMQPVAKLQRFRRKSKSRFAVMGPKRSL